MAHNRQQLPLPPIEPPPPRHVPLHFFRRGRQRLTLGPRPFIDIPYQHAPERDPSTVFKLLNDSGVFNDDLGTQWFSCYNPTISITLDGPEFELVTVMMALDTLDLPIPEMKDLLPAAKFHNYSYIGEMFSVKNMRLLIEYSSDAFGIHIRQLATRKQQIIEHLSRGWPVLIPYDADEDHLPCEAAGIKSRWAVIIGFCFEFKKPQEMNLEKTLYLLRQDPRSDRLYHFNSQDSHIMRDFFKILCNNSSKLYLYAKQGKSAKALIFEYDALIKSNANIRIAHPVHRIIPALIPEGGIRAGLRDQALLIKPREAES